MTMTTVANATGVAPLETKTKTDVPRIDLTLVGVPNATWTVAVITTEIGVIETDITENVNTLLSVRTRTVTAITIGTTTTTIITIIIGMAITSRAVVDGTIIDMRALIHALIETGSVQIVTVIVVGNETTIGARNEIMRSVRSLRHHKRQR